MGSIDRRTGVRVEESPGKASACDSCGESECSVSTRRQGESEQEFEDRRKLQSRLCRIRRKVVVLSGKGGVGKSTIAVSLAAALAQSGERVGLLDADVHGPSIPTMLGLEGRPVQASKEGLLPADVNGIKVMSLGLLLRDQDAAVIWRGPMKLNVIKQFLKDVVWGDLDYLIIDSPPGTGDEPLSVCQLIDGMDGAVIVTTPQRVAAVDVRKSITFCRELGVSVLGVVENMSGFACPKCDEVTPILRSGGGKCIAEDMGVPFLGSIPMDPRIADACDAGLADLIHCTVPVAAKVIHDVVMAVPGQQAANLFTPGGKESNIPIRGQAKANVAEKTANPTENTEDKHVRIAIPVENGKLSVHFGHCELFALIDVDPARKTILKRQDIKAPPHQPGLLPQWLAERRANLIIAGGMGQRAHSLFTEQGIEVVVGAPAETPETLVTHYLAGTLQSGENVCDH